ncbi:hypothetical protein A3H10_04660 [Candidatus Uhrbacteria bacterium RIFCSPLOWO2_12_FULL_46_10]|uniref:Uncharacterized protein n=1 Tax=Candidatus Uhrbacteria bacterium RIFCSPLOWO2_01_FULL_47_25 TaxID=1802402 RepID=A0A1F7UY65_9BACT|nr:MAG: hypothetical protein A2936_03910 [Candidatus Uhrbacteria bacterium RIFCSPLOWO2_01_FULL_47_25]OGL85900.1 MAG: hypothetical protein A3I37_00910 [Candidatus Uhrbacteria bacterium RIFCSPLOWO2_02_FULL_46_19]OGL91051.1 MAG: hypothetical protein A3H10_04660 [Candidatus Uhrbacteria bacterium RIFCSPLOWO2_12_FULL_46_10]
MLGSAVRFDFKNSEQLIFYTPFMILLPILLALQLTNTPVIVSTNDSIEADCGIKMAYGLAGCYITSSDTIILNSKYEWLWPETIPHEYAHRTVIKNNLLTEMQLYFANSEDMANQFATYWNNPEAYSVRRPLEAKWFQEHFIQPQIE